MAELLIVVMTKSGEKKRFLLHEFVIMPDHIHLLLTPRRASRWKRQFNTSRAASLSARRGKSRSTARFGKPALQITESAMRRITPAIGSTFG
jgi:REP element-mobilizing transposase RayT